MTDVVSFQTLPRLSASDVAAVAHLLDVVTDQDGLRPLSEHVWLHVREGGEKNGLHVLGRTPEGAVVAYAHIDITDEVEGASAELAVHPDHRQHGLGRRLVELLLDASPDGRLRLWSHGEQAGSTALAESMGFQRTRVLWQMRRSLYAPLPKPAVPAGVEIRPFRVGTDEDVWLDLNARAFAHLPDQGGWTRSDLDLRIQEGWFDADGFLMAWRGERLVGFHWTKVHGGGGHAHAHKDGGGHHHHPPIGEVYVVAVDPRERGSGLGRALTLAGLHLLRARGLDQVMLYVDASNTAAIALYEGLGFARWDTDVLYRRSSDGRPSFT
jgi:mycothiol synthase